ncbi:MAG: hypothetical protein HY815_27020 [Candidatus Riflebacteria bacterium]|nr:hypothetical protein [Candidatus Riflebacteria bacterium]
MRRCALVREGRQGGLLIVLVFMMILLSGAGLEATALWDNALARDREEELSFRLVRLQRAVREGERRLGRAPASLEELTRLEPPVLPRVPLDPMTQRPTWHLTPGDSALRVQSTAPGEALDGTRYREWWAEPAGSTWRVVRGVSAR